MCGCGMLSMLAALWPSLLHGHEHQRLFSHALEYDTN